ncbi:putative oxidoreductase [Chitinophaga niastensis]|uniref:Putative oxidoreductase n=1 Tax=Chitinophaga niastensis TaxID=536980 RepID=A0A2P8HF55_CHINA|nr:DoxX family protein [Chitinophaga niastensis]PSL44858.1 putative oxidoreductase [Chitinophaga niastensis]
MKILALLGRILFSLIFIFSGLNHITGAGADYAAKAGVPAAGFLVPFAGLLALVGGLSVLLGYKVKYGAWLIVIFLIPVSIAMHNFWAMKDPMVAQMQMAMFMKNVSILGGALLLAYFGAGPYSIDNGKG